MINLMFFIKKVVFVILFIFVSNFNKIYAENNILLDKILIIIDNKIILKSDLDFIKKIEKLEFNYYNVDEYKINKIILEQIITHNILKKIFNYKDYKINNNDINKYLYFKSKNIFLDKEEFISYLKFNNININKYINFIKNKIIIKKIIKDKIYPIASITNSELNEYYSKIKNTKLLNKLLITYNFNLIKVKRSNIDKYNDLNIKKIKKLLLNTQYKNFNKFSNKDTLDKLFIKKIYVEEFKNVQYKDLSNILIYYLEKNNLDDKILKNMIGPIFIKDFIYFIKIKSINKNNNLDKLKLVNINYISNIKKNDELNKEKNFNYINKIYFDCINKKLFNFDKSNVDNINLGWKDINYYNSFIKNYIISTNVKSISKPFKYKNKWNLLYLNDFKYINKEDYFKNFFLKNYILKNKSLYLINEIVINTKNNLYINILDKFYNLN